MILAAWNRITCYWINMLKELNNTLFPFFQNVLFYGWISINGNKFQLEIYSDRKCRRKIWCELSNAKRFEYCFSDYKLTLLGSFSDNSVSRTHTSSWSMKCRKHIWFATWVNLKKEVYNLFTGVN